MLVRRILAAISFCGLLAFSLSEDDIGDELGYPEGRTDYGVSTNQELLGGSWYPYTRTPPTGPLHPPSKPDASNKTIYQFLKEDEQFSRLFKLVNFAGDIIKTLNDTSASISFFAPPDSVLRSRHGHRVKDLDPFSHPTLGQWDSLESLSMLEEWISGKHDDHKKKIIKKIVNAILSYHVLPQSFTAAELGKNTTYQTAYTPEEGSFGGKPLRISVWTPFSLIRPAVVVNYYAKVVHPDVKATNGIVHVVNNPVLPPPAVFQELFLFSDYFSTFSSAIQRTHLTDSVDWRYIPGNDKHKGSFAGSPAVTVFAPTNSAFRKLPEKLKFFLFSPFGERVLVKLIQFHIVPHVVLYSNYFANVTKHSITGDATPDCCMHIASEEPAIFEVYSKSSSDMATFFRPSSCSRRPTMSRLGAGTGVAQDDANKFTQTDAEPIFSHTYDLPTLFEDHHLSVQVAQYERRLPFPPHRSTYHSQIVVNGATVKLADLPARNGAIHVIDKVLNPRGGERRGPPQVGSDRWFGKIEEADEWDGWENWLTQWAETQD